MNKNLYKLSFDKDSFELNYDYERLADYEKEIISNMSVDTFFDYDSNDFKYICFFITDTESIKSYVSILKNNLIKYELNNISNLVIENKIDIESDIIKTISPTSQIKFNIFIEDVNYWILQNLDIDIVLDRISEVGGLDNLRQVEKEFLKKYK